MQMPGKRLIQPRLLVMSAAALLYGAPVAADSGWLDKLKSVFGGEGTTEVAGKLTNDDIRRGLKEALRVGSEAVVDRLGTEDGFNGDPVVRIPLPDALGKVREALARIGMEDSLDDLELGLNRAAEAAIPKARQLFLGAIEDMTLEDVAGIFNGPDDAATRYFQERLSAPLAEEMQPMVTDSLADVGAAQVYAKLMDQYQSLPFVPEIDADLDTYVVDKGLDAVFHYLAEEEAAIRRDPVKRTTELLKRVFAEP
jgi:hypothetical protein